MLLARPCAAQALQGRRVRAQRQPRTAAARCCAAETPRPVSVEEVLQFEFGVVNKKTRSALLRERSIATVSSADALRAQLEMLRSLLAVTPDDFSCCLCVCDARETGALLELGAREVAQRLAIVRAALPDGVDAGKIVAAAPSLLLQDDTGTRVREALDLIRETGADPAELANDRPGSFGGMLVKICRVPGHMELLAPSLRAWAMVRSP
jgi:hypothetical protein